MGDVHGEAALLETALDTAAEVVDKLILVGDYVNRGSDTRRVLDLLVSARKAWGTRLILLRGNHEEVLLRFLEGAEPSELIRHNGLTTVRSYLGADLGRTPLARFRACFPLEHLDLLRSLDLYYETDDLLVSHVGFDPADPEGRTLQQMVLGSFPELFTGLVPMPKMTVCGHYVQSSGSIYQSGNFICLDSGCGTLVAGTLSLLTLTDMRIRQFRRSE